MVSQAITRMSETRLSHRFLIDLALFQYICNLTIIYNNFTIYPNTMHSMKSVAGLFNMS